jgi:hypothetical protein
MVNPGNQSPLPFPGNPNLFPGNSQPPFISNTVQGAPVSLNTNDYMTLMQPIKTMGVTKSVQTELTGQAVTEMVI